MKCPSCHHKLSEEQVKKIWAEYCGKQTSPTKAKTSAANGKKGGRPLTYFQNVYDLIPHNITRLPDKVFEVELSISEDPIEDGFRLRCGHILWDCRWNRGTRYVEVFENERIVKSYNTINNSAKTAAQCLVEDIHREKLMRTNPADPIKFILEGRRGR